MFLYCDERLVECEAMFRWDQALTYLENMYLRTRTMPLLNSLVGYSWYYLVEGPIISKEYGCDDSLSALYIWKKYLDLGIREKMDDSFFRFIAGYTLLMDGYYLGAGYEQAGFGLMEKCAETASNPQLKELAIHFIANQNSSKKYISIINGKEICSQLFSGNSLLEKYFVQLYG